MLGNTGCMCVCMYCARMCLYSSGLSFVLVASTGSCYLVFFAIPLVMDMLSACLEIDCSFKHKQLVSCPIYLLWMVV